MVRIASGIEPEWLLDLFPERVTEKREARVEPRRRARGGGERALLRRHRDRGEPRRAGAGGGGGPAGGQGRGGGHRALRGRGGSGSATWRECVSPRATAAAPSWVRSTSRRPWKRWPGGCAVSRNCAKPAGMAGWCARWSSSCPARRARRLEELAPTRIRLPGGRNTPVHYPEGDQPPWIASRLQDFFGMRETPRVAGGKVAVVVHLLAPNQRPVQTTTDLAGILAAALSAGAARTGAAVSAARLAGGPAGVRNAPAPGCYHTVYNRLSGNAPGASSIQGVRKH